VASKILPVSICCASSTGVSYVIRRALSSSTIANSGFTLLEVAAVTAVSEIVPNALMSPIFERGYGEPPYTKLEIALGMTSTALGIIAFSTIYFGMRKFFTLDAVSMNLFERIRISVLTGRKIGLISFGDTALKFVGLCSVVIIAETYIHVRDYFKAKVKEFKSNLEGVAN